MATYGINDFAVSDFMSKVENLGGVARKDRFSVEITPPILMTSEIQAGTIQLFGVH